MKQDWIHSDDHLLLDDPLHPGLGPQASTSTTKLASAVAASLAIDRAALKKQKVPAPTDDPVKLAKPCPVCKEKWKAEFEEEEEEWVFWNAVEVDGVVCLFSTFPFPSPLSSSEQLADQSVMNNSSTTPLATPKRPPLALLIV